MSAVEFDSYRLVKDFEAAGFTEAQAVAFVDALRAWQTEMAKTFATKADLQLTEERLRSEMAELRGELRTEIRDSRIAIIQWVAGMMVVQTVALVGLMFGLARFFVGGGA